MNQNHIALPTLLAAGLAFSACAQTPAGPGAATAQSQSGQTSAIQMEQGPRGSLPAAGDSASSGSSGTRGTLTSGDGAVPDSAAPTSDQGISRRWDGLGSTGGGTGTGESNATTASQPGAAGRK